MKEKVYKIRNLQGKFSTGGMNPSFTSRGKAWGSKCDIKNHLSQIKVRNDWTVMEFSIKGIAEYPVQEFIETK